jgi:hypothetical protein
MITKETRQLILDKCPDYDEISNYVYLESDLFSKELICQYQDYVFTVDITKEKELEKLELVNKAMKKYITDYNFSKALKKELKKEFMNKKFIHPETLMDSIIKFMELYEEEALRNISNTKWI